MEPIENWDEAYLQSIKADSESVVFEKKASQKLDPLGDKSGTREELEKQVCAFANAGGGFLVYGIDKTGHLDAGVAAKVTGQEIKSWVEQVIPGMLQPPITTCQAKFIRVSSFHAPDRTAYTGVSNSR